MSLTAKRVLFELAQWAIMLFLWGPFILATKAAYWTLRFFQWAGDALVRPLYYWVVQAKRRSLGDALWQEHDYQLGIFPPCDHCGVQVPPGRHKESCEFLQPKADVA